MDWNVRPDDVPQITVVMKKETCFLVTIYSSLLGSVTKPNGIVIAVTEWRILQILQQ